MKHSPEYISMLCRINKAPINDLEELQKSLDRLWDIGAFTDKEFMRLDGRILVKRIEAELCTP